MHLSPATMNGIRDCPTCSGQKWARIESVANKQGLDGEVLRLATCQSCGTVFQPVVVAPEVLASHYEYMGHFEANIRMTPFLDRRFRRMLQRLVGPDHKDRVPRPTILDVGCGAGLLLHVAEDLGWQPFATEISPSCVQILRRWLGPRLYCGELPRAPFEPASFDVITMAEVIEHLPDPFSYLRAAHRLLAPGGRLFLTTPNFDGLSARLWRTGWRVVAHEHLNYFGLESARRLVEASGFTNVEIRTAHVDVEMFGTLRRKLLPARPRPQRASQRSNGASSKVVEPSKLRARVVDQGAEVLNHVVGALEIGDKLKIIARRNS
jgi:SAM-dependent methyltransferase